MASLWLGLPLAQAAPDSAATVLPTAAEVPAYRVKLPPATRLSYSLRRGVFSGNGQLQWQPPDGREPAYRLQLEGKVAGLSVLNQTSTGEVGAGGLVPARFSDHRMGGRDRSALFDRSSQTVGFSSSDQRYALVPGAQDRLSWMLQLPAILAAEPRRRNSGERIRMMVVGSRGDADVWVFRAEGEEPVSTGQGQVRALKFVREPRKANDTEVEVWLDPARHLLPVRARLGGGSEGDVLELLLSADS